MKTDKLTPEQEAQLKDYRKAMFERAVGTVTNRAKAEKAALELTKELMKNPEIHWVSSPQEAKELYDSLRDFSQDCWWGSLRYALDEYLRCSLGDSLDECLWDYLKNSLRDSLADSGWIAFYSFPEKIGLVSYDEKRSNQLKCYRKLMKHCFAFYDLEGHIILVEKPVKTTVKDGKLIDIEFG